jgi:hypothetical protein
MSGITISDCLILSVLHPNAMIAKGSLILNEAIVYCTRVKRRVDAQIALVFEGGYGGGRQQ